MPTYLTLDEVLRIRELLIAEFGSASGVRDFGLIESCSARRQDTIPTSSKKPLPFGKVWRWTMDLLMATDSWPTPALNFSCN